MKKFVAWYLPEILSGMIIISVLVVLWHNGILQLFSPVDVDFMIVFTFAILVICVLVLSYLALLTVIEWIFDKVTATYTCTVMKREITNKSTVESTTYYRGVNNAIIPLSDEDCYIHVSVSGEDVRICVSSKTYNSLAIGDKIKIQREEKYRLGFHISISYYFVEKIN